LQERELYGWIRRLAAGIRTAVDVGANDGMYTLYFLSSTPAKRALSFEPSTNSLADLSANLALNRLSHDGRLQVVARKVGCAVDGEWTTLDSRTLPGWMRGNATT
jgi:FkbM family methyltransferase